MNDTIAAIATSLGSSGLGVIRISGAEALLVAENIVKTAQNVSVQQMKPYTCAYGHIVDGEENVDEVIVTVFHEPHSYTGENVVELSIHGSTPILQHTLRLCLDHGARLAHPGEFTKRAFLNGKMDLAQAEAVANMISAKSIHSAKAARAIKEGRLSRLIADIRKALLSQAANAAAWIDFPEEDTGALDTEDAMEQLYSCYYTLQKLLGQFSVGEMLQHGLRTAIIGKPNVGKSTLMNLLCGQNRSIVSQFAGTTRDVVTETVQLSSVTLRLADTAGVRDTHDPIERLGVDRALEEAKTADLVLVVLDGSHPLEPQDRHILSTLSTQNVLVIMNKSDLPCVVCKKQLPENCIDVVSVSAKKAQGLEALDKAISKYVASIGVEPDGVYLANLRQYQCASAATSAVKEAIDALAQNLTWDVVGVCIEEALEQLLMLTGENVNGAVVDEVFSTFCVGK